MRTRLLTPAAFLAVGAAALAQQGAIPGDNPPTRPVIEADDVPQAREPVQSIINNTVADVRINRRTRPEPESFVKEFLEKAQAEMQQLMDERKQALRELEIAKARVEKAEQGLTKWQGLIQALSHATSLPGKRASPVTPTRYRLAPATPIPAVEQPEPSSPLDLPRAADEQPHPVSPFELPRAADEVSPAADVPQLLPDLVPR